MLIITVNRHVIFKNRREGRADPPLRVSRGRYGKPRYCSEITFNGRGRLIYSPQNPLPCGAVCWLELEDD